IRELSDIYNLLNVGCDKVSINSAAIKRPIFIEEGAKRFGSQCIVVAIDAKEVSKGKWHIFTHGGRNDTGIDALTWAKETYERGAGELLVTSMDADGTKAGFDNRLNKKISELVNIPVIASGGAGTMQHMEEAFTVGNADAALAASIFHFKEIDIMELKKYLRAKDIPVRI
ncbi:MAG: imidazole glycerol phosphate synthase subunit HisF, partial [Sulfurovum sp.]